jgi:protein-S-isoprenylcysteine O-methyltransferase Ste14
MALFQSMENQGNYLFKYRGQFPILLFVLTIPFIYSTNYGNFSEEFSFNLINISIILSVIGFFIRFYTIGTTPKGTSGRNTKEQVANTLNSSGMYSMLRHPLYLGNYLIWFGIALSTFSIFFILIMSLLFWLYYERIMIAEERFLEKKFGDDFIKWSNTLPAFIPNIFNFRKSSTPFSFITILRREYASVLSCIVGFLFVELLKNIFVLNLFNISKESFLVLIISAFIALILRSLKHYSSILDEKGRS